MKSGAQVYITQSNAARIVYRVDRTMLQGLEGEIYTKRIFILSDGEKRRLLAIRKFFEDPELFIESYFGAARRQNDEDMVFEGLPPAYHADADCGRLHAEYTNYEIPEQIRDRAATEPEIIERFRKWFKLNCHLLDDAGPKYRPDHFLLRLRGEFQVDVRDIRQIVRPNSGITDFKNASMEDIRAEIDRILHDAGRWFAATWQNRSILQRYQKKTYLAYKDAPLPDNGTGVPDEEVKTFLKDYDARFKKPLKFNLIMYYRMRYNPALNFSGNLLDQVGFQPCRSCHSSVMNNLDPGGLADALEAPMSCVG